MKEEKNGRTQTSRNWGEKENSFFLRELTAYFSFVLLLTYLVDRLWVFNHYFFVDFFFAPHRNSLSLSSLLHTHCVLIDLTF